MNQGLYLSYEQRRQLREEIRDFYLEEQGKEISVLQQEGILELFMERLAPMIYHNAYQDAKVDCMQKKEDLQRDYCILHKCYQKTKNELADISSRIAFY